MQTRQGQCTRAKLVCVCTVCVCTRYGVHHVKICIIPCKLYFIKEGSRRDDIRGILESRNPKHVAAFSNYRADNLKLSFKPIRISIISLKKQKNINCKRTLLARCNVARIRRNILIMNKDKNHRYKEEKIFLRYNNRESTKKNYFDRSKKNYREIHFSNRNIFLRRENY